MIIILKVQITKRIRRDDIQSIFNKKSQQSPASKQETTFNQGSTTKQGATVTSKQGSIHVFTQKVNSLNAEML